MNHVGSGVDVLNRSDMVKRPKKINGRANNRPFSKYFGSLILRLTTIGYLESKTRPSFSVVDVYVE